MKNGGQVAELSIIVPLLNEAATVGELVQRLAQMLEHERLVGEIILVDDGSSDATWQAICLAAQADPRVRGVRLQRNFGKSAALQAGLDAAAFGMVATLDGDLQDDPDEIPQLLAQIPSRADLAVGWKQQRQDSLFRCWASWWFNWLISRISGLRLHDHNCGLKVGRREVFDAIDLYGGMHRFIPVLAQAYGFRVTECPVRHHPRRHGKSRYGWERVVVALRDLTVICFRVLHRERIQAALTASGELLTLAGAIGMLYLAIYWWLRMHGWVAGPPVHQRPLLWYAAVGLLLGIQLSIASVLTALIVHQGPVARRSYVISSTVDGRDQAAASRREKKSS